MSDNFGPESGVIEGTKNSIMEFGKHLDTTQKLFIGLAAATTALIAVMGVAGAAGMAMGGMRRMGRGARSLGRGAGRLARSAPVARMAAGTATAGRAILPAIGRTAQAARPFAGTAARMGGRALPFVGLGLGAVGAIHAARQGNWGEAGLELAAGGASMIPGVGTAASLGIIGGLEAKRHHDRMNAQPTPAPIDPATVQTDRWLEEHNTRHNTHQTQSTPNAPTVSPMLSETDVLNLLSRVVDRQEETNRLLKRNNDVIDSISNQ